MSTYYTFKNVKLHGGNVILHLTALECCHFPIGTYIKINLCIFKKNMKFEYLCQFTFSHIIWTNPKNWWYSWIFYLNAKSTLFHNPKDNLCSLKISFCRDWYRGILKKSNLFYINFQENLKISLQCERKKPIAS